MNATERSRVLVIDDSPGVIELLDSVLSPEYDVSFATQGADGLTLARRFPADLILLDVLMPEMDGFEVCRRLRAQETMRDIPIVFLTSLASPGDEELGLMLGADDFIAQADFSRRCYVPVFITICNSRNRKKRSNATMKP